MDEEKILRDLLQAVCAPVAASPEFKTGLLKHLTRADGTTLKVSPSPLWKHMKLWVAISGVIILTTITYGIYLPQVIFP